ncbi:MULTISPECIES: hypothetical protein [unclassified Thalassospira]|uniref:hypothetical protein n=1 Tax=unclassified Thalassospira TaxID=2648997 RepID=UPI000EB89BF3|nr:MULTISPECIES: hypothetical protein [unclassified Thalassospira]HAI29879.1 hypothetical protein [Thalassospira sp.]
MFLTKNPVLLGEAPKGEHSYAFNWNAWTTLRLADSVGFSANNIHKYFRPRNLLDEVQLTGPDTFDPFDHQSAIQNVGNVISPGDRVICVGSRVTKAVADYFQLDNSEIPEFIPWCSWGRPYQNCQFSRIPHPANRAGRWCYSQGQPAQPKEAVSFLIATVRERYSDAFQHLLDAMED